MAERVACVIGVLGAPLTGKGLFAHEWIARPFTGVKLVWSPVEHSDNYAGLLGVRPSTSIPAMGAQLTGGARAVVFVPSLDRDPRSRELLLHRQFDQFCRIAPACGGARVLVEELSRVTLPSWAPPAWSNISTAGSHSAIEVMATAQRPAHVDKNFLGGCTEIRCYRMNERPDADAVARTLFEATAAELMALPDRHFVHLWRSPRRVERGVQPLPGERRRRRGGDRPGRRGAAAPSPAVTARGRPRRTRAP